MNQKKKFDINSVPGTTLILFIICAVISGALAGTNMLTKGRITALAEENEKSSMVTVLDAEEYKEQTAEITFDDGTAETVKYYEAVSGGQKQGIIVTKAYKGYGGDVSVMVGVKTDGTVSHIKILAADDETPGLGRNVMNRSFYSQYEGKSKGVTLVKNQPDGENSVVKLTGASYSSAAVHNAVTYALEVADKTAGAKPDTGAEENTNETEGENNGQE